ncbi:MAG: PqqD family protein [Smithellaceae bacterium]|nr:PqqD family protein [Smithellaceae bacterium]
MNVSSEVSVVRIPDPVTAPVGDELVMFSAAQGKYYGLNEVASVIWQRIEQPMNVALLCEELQRAFDVTEEQCREDILPYLDELYTKGLIRILPPP